MDKRERYDPEDLESLLSERAFDELLAEERAYVLRHVSGREEYEAMRATLGHLRALPSDRDPITADPEVRDRVLAAFREAHRPQWRIWLNSISLWAMPERPALLWRPALALCSLALLITAGVFWFGKQDGLENAVAEVKLEAPKEPAVPRTPPAPQAADRANATSIAEPSTTRSELEQPISPSEHFASTSSEAATGAAAAHEDLTVQFTPPVVKDLEEPPAPEAAPRSSAGFVQEEEAKKANAETLQLADIQVAEISGVSKTSSVERAENKRRERAAKGEKESVDDMNLTANADLFVLLKAAW